jgi:hypothetical protein
VHADGGGRPGFATVVTTTEAQGGAAVEQHPPSLTSRRNRQRRRFSLDGSPLLRQPNDGGHGSGRGDDLLPARRRRRWEYRQGLNLDPMSLGLCSTVFLFSKIYFLCQSVTTDTINHSFFIIQIVLVTRPDIKYRFPTDNTNTFFSSTPH